jgi:hypothetical protein
MLFVILGNSLVERIQHLVPSFDGGDDFVWISSPVEGLRLLVGARTFSYTVCFCRSSGLRRYSGRTPAIALMSTFT